MIKIGKVYKGSVSGNHYLIIREWDTGWRNMGYQGLLIKYGKNSTYSQGLFGVYYLSKYDLIPVRRPNAKNNRDS